MGWHVVVFNTFRRKAVQDQCWPVQRFWNCWMRPFVFKAAWNARMLILKDCYESQMIKNPNVCLNKNKTKRLLSKSMDLCQPNTFDGKTPAIPSNSGKWRFSLRSPWKMWCNHGHLISWPRDHLQFNADHFNVQPPRGIVQAEISQLARDLAKDLKEREFLASILPRNGEKDGSDWSDV